MKRVVCILLAAFFVLSFAACGDNSTKSGSTETQNDNTANSAAAKGENDKTTLNKKALVVYYSATGSTKAVTEKIAENLSADIFEIEPKSAYTKDDLDWRNDNSRVSVEHNDESKRDVPLVKNTPDNWEQYDTVYVGYPIWWGIAAWPVNGFVKNNDFTGKTVIPFCTSSSSGIGNSGELLKSAAGSAAVTLPAKDFHPVLMKMTLMNGWIV